jgi:hypothetical protein
LQCLPRISHKLEGIGQRSGGAEEQRGKNLVFLFSPLLPCSPAQAKAKKRCGEKSGFSRYAYLYEFPVDQVINPQTFPQFVKWFEKRAQEI